MTEPSASLGLQLSGHVEHRVNGVLTYDDHNLVVDAAFEAVCRALTGADTVSHVAFAHTTRPVSPGLRTLSSVVGRAGVTSAQAPPIIGADAAGLRSLITWTGTLTPTAPITYDTLGLMTASGLLLAAIALQSTTLNIAEAVSVRWTLRLRN